MSSCPKMEKMESSFQTVHIQMADGCAVAVLFMSGPKGD